MDIQGIAIERLHPFSFSDAERDRRWGSTRAAMAERGLDALVVWGSSGAFVHSNASMRWLTNVNSEGYLVFPLDGEPVLFSFENGLNPGWVKDWRGAVPEFAKAVAAHVDEAGLDGARLGLVTMSGMYGELNGFPYTTYIGLAERLGKATLEDATSIVEDLRRRKSAEEIEALHAGCEIVRLVFDSDPGGGGSWRPRLRDPCGGHGYAVPRRLGTRVDDPLLPRPARDSRGPEWHLVRAAVRQRACRRRRDPARTRRRLCWLQGAVQPRVHRRRRGRRVDEHLRSPPKRPMLQASSCYGPV